MVFFMKKIFAFLFVFAVVGVPSAQADHVYIANQDHHFSVSYPDTWHRTNHQKSDEAFTVVAPGQGHMARCRVRARPDERFAMYPRHYDASIQKAAFNERFWSDYLGEYDNAEILFYEGSVQVDKGMGSYVEAEFNEVTGPYALKRGMMAVTYQNDTAYIIECKAAADQYTGWRASFIKFLSDVQIQQISPGHASGYYRDFTRDRTLKINGLTPADAFYY